MRIPVYVGETSQQGKSDPEASTMRSFCRMAENLSRGAVGVSEERAARDERLANVTYEELLQDRLAYGSPDTVVEKLKYISGSGKSI